MLKFLLILPLFSADLDLKEEMEGHLRGKAETVLQTMIPLNKFAVSVNVEFSSVESVRKILRIDPNSKVTLVRDDERRCEDEKPPFGGIPGTDSHISERLPLLRRAMRGSTSSEERRRAKYEYTRTMEIVKEGLGDVTRITMGVAIDIAHKEMRDSVERMMREVVGIDEGRGDSISVEVVKFFTPPPESEIEVDGFRVTWKMMAVLLGVAMLIGSILGVWFHFRKPGPRTMIDIPAITPEDLERRTKWVDDLPGPKKKR